MEIILGIIAVIFGISLYDFLAGRSQQVTSTERNELVFEHRNREYGAYVIRRDYNMVFLIILACVILSIGSVYGIYKIIQEISEEVVPLPPVDDTTFAVAAPPPEDTPPPPPEPEIPQLEKTIQFLPPVVTDNPETEDPPTDQDLAETQAGTTTQEGNDDPFGEIPETTGPVKVEVKEEEPLTNVDEFAAFPGGAAAMKKFLGENLQYPQVAIEEELQGKCFLRFVVDTDGNISKVSVTRGVPDCPECDKEAIRVVKKMPKWTPAKNGGKVVVSYFNLPVTFKLQ